MMFFRIPPFPGATLKVLQIKSCVNERLIFNPGKRGTPIWLQIPKNKIDAETLQGFLEEASGQKIERVEGFN